MALQHLRSGTANKRPIPTAMSDGQLAVNTNLASPGLFFKDSNGDLVKAGPVHVGTTAPNTSPASTAATVLSLLQLAQQLAQARLVASKAMKKEKCGWITQAEAMCSKSMTALHGVVRSVNL